MPSTYTPGPPPKSLTIANAAGTSTFDGVDAAGMPVRVVFSVIADGQSHPVTGSSFYDTSSVKRVDAYIQIYTLSKSGNVIQRGTIVLSPDARTMTIHGIGVSQLTGQQQSDSVSVYEKQ